MIKKKLIAIILIAATIFALVGCIGSTSSVLSGSGSRSFTPSRWKMTGSWNGHVTRDFDLTAENADIIHVESKNSSGLMTVLITQDGKEQIVDVSGYFSDSIDLGDFETGKVKIRLDLDNAKDIELEITWR